MEQTETQTPELQAGAKAWTERVARFTRLTGVKVEARPEALQDLSALHGLDGYEEMEEVLLAEWAIGQVGKLAFVGQEQWVVQYPNGTVRDIGAFMATMRQEALQEPGTLRSAQVTVLFSFSEANATWLDLKTNARYATPLKPYLDFLTLKLIEESEGTDALDELKHQQTRLVKRNVQEARAPIVRGHEST